MTTHADDDGLIEDAYKQGRIDLLDELIEQPIHPLTREWLLSVRERIEGGGR